MTFTYEAVTGGSFNKWASGGRGITGYNGFSNGFEKVQEHIINCTGPGFTYFYIPDVDSAEHAAGNTSERVIDLIGALDEQLLHLREQLPDDVRIIVTADHGLVNVEQENQKRVNPESEIMKYLDVPHSGESVTPIFHVKQGKEDAFRNYFMKNFGDLFILLTADEIESLGLFGTGSLSEPARNHLGTFVGIAPKPYALIFETPDRPYPPHIGFHGGLRPGEMEIPLIIA
jgi:hypothetical protein